MHTSPCCKGRAKICCEKEEEITTLAVQLCISLVSYSFEMAGNADDENYTYTYKIISWKLIFFHPQSTCIDHTRKSTCVYTWFVKVNHVFYLWSVLRFNTGFHNTIKFYCCWVEMQSNLFLRWVYIKHDFSCTFTAHPFSEVYCCKFW